MGSIYGCGIGPQSYLQPYPLEIFYSNGLILEWTLASLIAFLRLLLLEYWGGPEKD